MVMVDHGTVTAKGQGTAMKTLLALTLALMFAVAAVPVHAQSGSPLSDSDAIVAAGGGATVYSTYASLPAALRREVTVTDYAAHLRLLFSSTASLAFRPTFTQVERVLQFAAHYPSEIGAENRILLEISAPDPNTPSRPVSASSPAAGSIRGNIPGTSIDGTPNAGGPDLLRVARYVGGEWQSVEASFEVDGAGYRANGLAPGTYVLYVVDSTTGIRSNVTAFVTVP